MTPDTTEERCPACGGPMVEREGPYGDFLGCAQFPLCRGARSFKVTQEHDVDEDDGAAEDEAFAAGGDPWD